MISPLLHKPFQIVSVLLERIGGHRQAYDNAALHRLPSKVWQRNPADEARDLARHLDREAGHIEALNGDWFGQRRVAGSRIKRSHDLPFVEAA